MGERAPQGGLVVTLVGELAREVVGSGRHAEVALTAVI
jgi:hypothetical protein